jgi:Arm domain-containing DNA-binding protein/integrase-like protein
MLTNTECRNLKPQAKPYKMSDGGGLFLFITPAGGKVWRMGYRLGRRQREVAFGAYPAVSLQDAREKRDAAKKLLANDIDPAIAKQDAKRELAALRPFADWADDWLDNERGEWDEKTITGKERFVRYLKEEFGTRLIPAIKRPDVLLYLRDLEKTGKLETRDRVRATGEQPLCRSRRQRSQSLPQSGQAIKEEQIRAPPGPDRTRRRRQAIPDHRRTMGPRPVR